MSARRRLARLELREIARQRMADPAESAWRQRGLARKVIKALRNRRARRAGGTR